MWKRILTFGAISGGVSFGLFAGGSQLAISHGVLGQISGLVGFLLMFHRAERDLQSGSALPRPELGGVIRFGQGCWSASDHPGGQPDVRDVLGDLPQGDRLHLHQRLHRGSGREQKSRGLAGEELESLLAAMDTMKQRYASPLFRIPWLSSRSFRSVADLPRLCRAPCARATSCRRTGR